MSGVKYDIELVKNYIVQNKLARSHDDFVGCTPEEIEIITKSLKLEVLPKNYALFLSSMGKSKIEFLIGSSFFYPEILENRAGLEELFQEDGIKSDVLDSSLVFHGHQGYVYSFFYLNDSEENIYDYLNEEMGIGFVQKGFFSWMMSVVDDLVMIRDS